MNFFGKIDDKNKFYTSNAQDVDNPVTFSLKVRELLNSLSNKAYADPKFYATEDIELDSSSSVLGLAQGTRDLSGPDCKTCLLVAVVTLDTNFTPLLMSRLLWFLMFMNQNV